MALGNVDILDGGGSDSNIKRDIFLNEHRDIQQWMQSLKKVLCPKNQWLAIKLFDLDDGRPFIEFLELVYLLTTETFLDSSVMS